MKKKYYILFPPQVLDALLLLLLSTQLGKYFFTSESFLNGVRTDYLAPQITLFDVVFFIRLFFEIWQYRQNIWQTWYRFVQFLAQSTSVAFKIKVIIFRLNSQIRLHWPLLMLILTSFLLSTRSYLLIYKILRFVQVFFLLRFFSKTTLSRNQIYLLLLVVMFFSLLLSLYQLSTSHSWGGIWYWLGERLLDKNSPAIATSTVLGREFLRSYATFSHPNSMGGFFLAWFYFISIEKKTSIYKYLVQLFSICLVLLSFSQLAIAVLLVLIFSNNLYNTKCLTCNISKLVTILVVFSLFLYISIEQDGFIKRSNMAVDAWSIIKSSPLGVGIGNYLPSANLLPKSASWYEAGRQPVHNIFLLLTSEIGWWGYVLLLVYAKKHHFHPKLNKNQLNFCLLIGLLGMWDHYPVTLNQNLLQLPIIFALLKK